MAAYGRIPDRISRRAEDLLRPISVNWPYGRFRSAAAVSLAAIRPERVSALGYPRRLTPTAITGDCRFVTRELSGAAELSMKAAPKLARLSALMPISSKHTSGFP